MISHNIAPNYDKKRWNAEPKMNNLIIGQENGGLKHRPKWLQNAWRESEGPCRKKDAINLRRINKHYGNNEVQ